MSLSNGLRLEGREEMIELYDRSICWSEVSEPIDEEREQNKEL